jgi:xanthine dehydrogenase YagS FAD-binding subunit
MDYERTDNLQHARELLQRPGAVAMGGGTDLLVALREGVVAAELLVDLRGVARVSDIGLLPDGGLRIGTAVRVEELAQDPRVKERFPALAESCAAVGSVQLRNMGTLGGNLCQRPRCWYLRGSVSCFKNGGDSCPAAATEGANQYHAILGGGPCYIVHPSDPAVALTALEAVVHVTGPQGDRAVPIDSFYVLPSERMDSETVLATGEFVTHVEVPARSSGGRQQYVKLMQRGAWDFALVSIAAVRRADGTVRMVLGGVAPRPWRVNSSVEEDVASASLTDDDIETLAERAMYDAEPLSRNAYKVDLAKTLIRRAIAFVTADLETDNS